MHENLNRLFDVIDDIERINAIEFTFLKIHRILIHFLNFFLRAYFDIQIKIYDCFANYFSR